MTIPSRQNSVWVDVDGTLVHSDHAHVQAGGKFRFNRNFLETDVLNHTVAYLVGLLFDAGHEIVIVSGRNEAEKEETLNFLSVHGVRFHRAHFRSNKDQRPDHEVKLDILREHFSPNGPLFAVEDRPCVVAALRKEGVFVLDVNHRPLEE